MRNYRDFSVKILQAYVNQYIHSLLFSNLPLCPTSAFQLLFAWFMFRYCQLGMLSRYRDWLQDGGLREMGVRVPVWSRIFCLLCRPDRLWGPHSLTSGRYLKLFLLKGKATGAWSRLLTSNWSRGQGKINLDTHSPIRVFGIVLY
jgi:hypothetical protein